MSEPPEATGGAGALRELVVCSLEAWDEVWRRNQFFTQILLDRNAQLRVLFVEPPADPLYELANRRRPNLPRLRRIGGDGRLQALRPIKLLPRRVGPATDAVLRRQVTWAAGRVGFEKPTLWVNDVTYAPLIETTGWPSVYDVTDDWLLAPFSARELRRLTRLDRLALSDADEVVVCSSALQHDRGRSRPVHVIRNAVDVAHFQRPRERPADLPPPPTAVYVGTLHESRLDVQLIANLAASSPNLNVVLVGPIALSSSVRASLEANANVWLLGAKAHAVVPAYLQHADVLIVPHVVTPFTDSLDPIKAYEYSAVPRPVVATPVAGFRENPQLFRIASAPDFVSAVGAALAEVASSAQPSELHSWDDRAADFERVLLLAASDRAST